MSVNTPGGMKKHFVSFSGGKDSTAMLLMMLERGERVDRIISVDTSKEFPEMYDHIKRVQDHISPLKIETVRFDFDYFFSEHKKAYHRSDKKTKGYGFPYFNSRWCTRLKRDAINATIAGNNTGDPKAGFSVKGSAAAKKNVVQFLGYSADETGRAERFLKNDPNTRFPLIEWGVTGKEALDYCYSKGFDWGGLYEHMSRVSCWMCPLQDLRSLRALYFLYPEKWEELKVMQSKVSWQFRKDYTLGELEERFEGESVV